MTRHMPTLAVPRGRTGPSLSGTLWPGVWLRNAVDRHQTANSPERWHPGKGPQLNRASAAQFPERPFP